MIAQFGRPGGNEHGNVSLINWTEQGIRNFPTRGAASRGFLPARRERRREGPRATVDGRWSTTSSALPTSPTRNRGVRLLQVGSAETSAPTRCGPSRPSRWPTSSAGLAEESHTRRARPQSPCRRPAAPPLFGDSAASTRCPERIRTATATPRPEPLTCGSASARRSSRSSITRPAPASRADLERSACGPDGPFSPPGPAPDRRECARHVVTLRSWCPALAVVVVRPVRGPSHRCKQCNQGHRRHDFMLSVQVVRTVRGAVVLIIRRSSVRAPPAPPRGLHVLVGPIFTFASDIPACWQAVVRCRGLRAPRRGLVP